MLRFIETVWLAIAAMGIVFIVFEIFRSGFSWDVIWYFVVTVIAGAMFALRRSQRKKMEGDFRDRSR